jgi:hypothetical protein
MDTPQDFYPRDAALDGPPMPTQAEFEAVLDASEADVAVGRVGALAPVLARMRAVAERIRQESERGRPTDGAFGCRRLSAGDPTYPSRPGPLVTK